MEDDKDWTLEEIKKFHIYRKGIWILKEEVKELKKLLEEAKRRLDKEYQKEGGQGWFDWIKEWFGF